uniref:glucuronosyltransferase n=1 Tax=Meloidogyne hapla TaxID=6305 RepID=A0A1I8B9M9_MELHA
MIKCFNNKYIFILLIIFILNFANNNCEDKLKILVYSPTYGFSHMQYMCKIAETLAGAGHEVHFIRVIISEFEMELPQNLHKVYDIIPKGQSKVMDPQTIPSIQNPFKEAGTNRFLFPRILIIEFINNQLDFIEQMKKENFDVGISEFFDHFPFALFHIIGTRTKLAALAVPVLQGAARQFGIPTFSSFVTSKWKYLNYIYEKFNPIRYCFPCQKCSNDKFLGSHR